MKVEDIRQMPLKNSVCFARIHAVFFMPPRTVRAGCSEPAAGHGGTALADQPMAKVAGAWCKRALVAGIMAPIGNHTFRATGITAYLENGGTLEHAQQIAAHESPRTTKLYDRTSDEITLDEIERIAI